MKCTRRSSANPGLHFWDDSLLLATNTTEDLSLLNTNDASSLVLTLLTLLTRGLRLLEESNAAEAVARLVGLQSLHVVVDQTKTSGLTSSESGLEAIDHNELLIGNFVHLGHLGGELSLGDRGASGVDDINNLHIHFMVSNLGNAKVVTKQHTRTYELLAGQQLVVHELAGADRAGLVVRHLQKKRN